MLTVKVDRPFGSKHPRHRSISYPLNYGFIPNTLAADGHEIDAYLVGVSEPVETFEGDFIAIVQRHDDVEDKLVLAPAGRSFINEDIMDLIHFQEQFFNTSLIR